MGSLAKEIRQLLEENDVCEESEELDIDEIVGWAMEDDDCEEMDEGCGSKHKSDDDDEDDEDDDEMDEDVGICESRGYYTAKTEADQDFADGWIAAMKNISSRDVEDVQSGMKKAIAGHSVDYGKGYVTAIGHWQGHAPKQLNRAHSIGLVKAYKGFHGQGSFAHPENSSVKGRKSEDVDGGSEELDEAKNAMKMHASRLAKMTDNNEHSEALVYLASQVLKNKKLAKIAKAVADIQDALGYLTPELSKFSYEEIHKPMMSLAKRKLSPEDYQMISGAL